MRDVRATSADTSTEDSNPQSLIPNPFLLERFDLIGKNLGPRLPPCIRQEARLPGKLVHKSLLVGKLLPDLRQIGRHCGLQPAAPRRQPSAAALPTGRRGDANASGLGIESTLISI